MVRPLGYTKRGHRDYPNPIGDAPAFDIMCINLPVNYVTVPLINGGGVGQHRGIEAKYLQGQ